MKEIGQLLEKLKHFRVQLEEVDNCEEYDYPHHPWEKLLKREGRESNVPKICEEIRES